MTGVRNPDGSVKANAVRLEVTVRSETDSAWLVNYTPKVWIPKSQCEMGDHKPPTNRAELIIPAWLAQRKGLI